MVGRRAAIDRLRNLAEGASEEDVWEALGTAISELGWTAWFPGESIPFSQLLRGEPRPDWLPICADASGIARMGGTRVTLYSVIAAFRNGSTPEEIQQQYPSVDLADIYSTLAYYMRHQDEVNQYLADLRAGADQERRDHESRQPRDDFRQRLLARRKSAS